MDHATEVDTAVTTDLPIDFVTDDIVETVIETLLPIDFNAEVMVDEMIEIVFVNAFVIVVDEAMLTTMLLAKVPTFVITIEVIETAATNLPTVFDRATVVDTVAEIVFKNASDAIATEEVDAVTTTDFVIALIALTVPRATTATLLPIDLETAVVVVREAEMTLPADLTNVEAVADVAATIFPGIFDTFVAVETVAETVLE